MGCPCQGGIKAWTYTDGDGKATVFSTEVQALAAKIRAGNVGEVKPKK